MASHRTQEEQQMWQSISGKVKDLIMQYRHLERSIDRKEEKDVAAINYVENMIDDTSFASRQVYSRNINIYKEMNKIKDEISKIICNRSQKEIIFVGKEIGTDISNLCYSFRSFDKANGVMSKEAALESLDKFIKKVEPVAKPQKKGGKMSLSEFLGESLNSVKVSVAEPVLKQTQFQPQGRWTNLK